MKKKRKTKLEKELLRLDFVALEEKRGDSRRRRAKSVNEGRKRFLRELRIAQCQRLQPLVLRQQRHQLLEELFAGVAGDFERLQLSTVAAFYQSPFERVHLVRASDPSLAAQFFRVLFTGFPRKKNEKVFVFFWK